MMDQTAPAHVPGDQSRRQARWVCSALIGVLVALFIAQGHRNIALPVENIVSWNVVIDDGYYYLQVARNIARGHGSTFDRVNTTNGYQPLWALMLVPIFWFTDDPVTALRAALMLATLLGALSMVLLYIGLQRLVGLGLGLLVCAMIAANPYFIQIVQGGLETPALFACLGGLVALWAVRGERILAGHRRSCLMLGTVLGLTVLARVDAALILAPLCLALAVWGPGTWKHRLGRAMWIALPAIILIAPFVLWSLITQGVPMPISGLVKRWVAETFTPTKELFERTEQWRGVSRTLNLLVWPKLFTVDESIFWIKPLLQIPLAALAFLGLRLLWSRRARLNRLSWLFVSTIALGLVIHGLVLYYVYRSCGHWNYHYFFPFALFTTVLILAPIPLLLCDLGLRLDRHLRGRLQRTFAALGALLCVPLVGYLIDEGLPAAEARYQSLRKPPAESFRKCRLDAAIYIREHYPPQEVFGAWWAGTLGYFSDRRVVNLDGVINSADFFKRVLRPDAAHRYVLEGPITHLVDFFWRDPLAANARPSSRAYWWEHEKEHIVHRLRKDLRLTHRVPYRPPSGIYLMDVAQR